MSRKDVLWALGRCGGRARVGQIMAVLHEDGIECEPGGIGVKLAAARKHRQVTRHGSGAWVILPRGVDAIS